VLNTFVIFLSRVVGFLVDKVLLKNERGYGIGYWVTTIVAELVLGIVAAMIVAWFSRRREFRADAGSADLMATPRPMINALARLGGAPRGDLPQAFEAHGIAESPSKFLGLFASHPPIEERIAALQAASR
jgi:heat shock protein HtpX